MKNFKEMTEEELKPWLTGKNADLNSPAYNAAQLEYERRIFEKQLETMARQNYQLKSSINRVVNSLDRLTRTVGDLKDTWIQKFFWLGVVTIIVGVTINLISSFLKTLIGI